MNLLILHLEEIPLSSLRRHPALVAEIIAQVTSPHLREITFSMEMERLGHSSPVKHIPDSCANLIGRG